MSRSQRRRHLVKRVTALTSFSAVPWVPKLDHEWISWEAVLSSVRRRLHNISDRLVTETYYFSAKKNKFIARFHVNKGEDVLALFLRLNGIWQWVSWVGRRILYEEGDPSSYKIWSLSVNHYYGDFSSAEREARELWKARMTWTFGREAVAEAKKSDKTLSKRLQEEFG